MNWLCRHRSFAINLIWKQRKAQAARQFDDLSRAIMPLLTSNQHPVDPYLLLVSVKNISGVKDCVSETHFLCVSILWCRRDLIAYYQLLLLYHWKMGQTLALIGSVGSTLVRMILLSIIMLMHRSHLGKYPSYYHHVH